MRLTSGLFPPPLNQGFDGRETDMSLAHSTQQELEEQWACGLETQGPGKATQPGNE